MVNKEQIDAFINYNYIPLNKNQCIKRIVIIWAISMGLSLIGDYFELWILLTGAVSLLLSTLFIALITRYKDSQISRYLCDGLFYLYLAISFNLASYRVMALHIGSNWVLAVILIVLLIICIIMFLIVTLLNIKSGKFSESGVSRRTASLPIYGGIVGILFAKHLLQGQAQHTSLTLISYILLILSFVMSIPSINLLKAIYWRGQGGQGDGFREP